MTTPPRSPVRLDDLIGVVDSAHNDPLDRATRAMELAEELGGTADALIGHFVDQHGHQQAGCAEALRGPGQVHTDLKASALAQLPSGKFNANWLVLAVMAFNLTRAAATLTGPALSRATTATIRRKLITVPARIASSARRVRLHLPTSWPWETAWSDLFNRASGPPPAPAPAPAPTTSPPQPTPARRPTWNELERGQTDSHTHHPKARPQRPRALSPSSSVNPG